MHSAHLTIDQLCLSPFNVRKAVPSTDDTAPIEASILVEGLRVPIDVHQMRGSKTKWGAFAGRRRYYSIRRLVERGDLPKDWAVPVVVHDDGEAELIEKSITENLLRKDMDWHELCAGVAMAAAKGHTTAQIAHNLGQKNVRSVEMWLRLGQLAKPVFDAFAAGRIDLEQAQAYAATQDQTLQVSIFERLGADRGHDAQSWEIRRALKVGDAILLRQLRFVDADAYRQAGGRFELDLFADASEERGRVADEGTLQQLVDAKLAAIRDEVRAATSRPDLRFVAEPPKDQWQGIDNQLSVTPKRLEDGSMELPSDQVVAHLAIGSDGQPAITYWWESRTAKFGTAGKKAEKPVSTGPIGNAIADPHYAKPAADAAIRRDEGFSQDATFVMRAVRKAILRAILVDDAQHGGTVGIDYLVFAQARQLLDKYPSRQLGMRPIAGDSYVGVSQVAFTLAQEHVAAMPASKTLGAAIEAIRREPFFTEPDVDAAFIAYRTATPETRTLAAALVAGIALEQSLAAPGYEMKVHDVVAFEANGEADEDVRRHWEPTTELLDLIPKVQRLTAVEPFVDRATLASWAKLKSADLTAAVLRVLIRAGKGATWVHPLLRFTSPFLAHQLHKEAAE